METIKALEQQFLDFPIIAMSGDSLALPLLAVALRLGAAEELLEATKRVLRPGRRPTVKH